MHIDTVIDLRKLAKTSIPESRVIVKDATGQRYKISWSIESSGEGNRESELLLLIDKV